MSSNVVDLSQLSEADLIAALTSATQAQDAQLAQSVGQEFQRRLIQASTMQSTLQSIVAQQQQTFATTMQQQQQAAQQQQTVSMQQPGLLGGKIKLEKPPKFDGTSSKLSNFLFCVKQYMSTVGLTDAVEQQKFATLLLEGRALTWWRTECDRAMGRTPPVDLLTTKQFGDLEHDLEAAFLDVDRDDRLRRKLLALRQTTSVQKYTEQFRAILIEMGSARPDDATVLFQYVAGLKDEVQLHVCMANPTVLADAELQAERVDSALFLTRRKDNRPPPRSRQANTSRNSGYAPMDIDTMQQQRNSNTQGRNAKSKSTVICHRCGKAGHIRKDCRVKLPPNQQSQQSSQPFSSKN